MSFKHLLCVGMLSLACVSSFAQSEELIRYGNFEKWITRKIDESGVLGGKTKTLMEIGPNNTIVGNKAYVNQGGSPWATSNVYAKVCGVVKTNSSVYKDSHAGGSCAKLETHIESAKAIGIINIKVLAAGSLFTGEMIEPITSTSNPLSKMSMGMPFTRRPKAIKLDYKVQLAAAANRIRETGFSATKEIAGKDYPDMVVILQKRTEDAKGNIHAKRVGTCIYRFKESTGWKENQTFTIKYGDITKQGDFKSWQGLITGEGTYYAKNSKGKNVKIIEDGWADANETPTHVVVKFDSSHGGAYVGSPGNTLWVDNVRFVY